MPRLLLTTEERFRLLGLLETTRLETSVGCNQDTGWALAFRDAHFDDPYECIRWLLDVGVFTRPTGMHLSVDWNKRQEMATALANEILSCSRSMKAS